MENERTVTEFKQNSSESERTRFRLWLQRQFTERCKRNSRYSLRAFAKSLQMDASTLSKVLSGKRILSKHLMIAVCDKVGASPQDRQAFGLIAGSAENFDNYLQVQLDTFAVISDWYHYAILELTYVSGFKNDAKWISRKLAITVEEVKSALDRLMRLGLLIEENGSLIKSSKWLTNQSAVDTSSAHRDLQRQIVSKALIAIDECPSELKDITSMTMAIDINRLAEARQVIRQFRRQLCALLEDGQQSQVYNLAIQLYPISKQENSKQESL